MVFIFVQPIWENDSGKNCMLMDNCKLLIVRAELHLHSFAKVLVNREGFQQVAHVYFHTLSSSSSDLPLVSGTKRHINQAASIDIVP
jgi:hypothetical protein